jgi:hypothetical protein
MMRADELRARIFSEHKMLRRLMVTLRAATVDAMGGGPVAIAGMRDAMGELAGAFERHLQFEERELVPVLKRAQSWGPVRATHLADEHAAQRATLAALAEDVGSGRKPLDQVADEIAWFVRGMLRDMVEEEAGMLSPCALGEEEGLIPRESPSTSLRTLEGGTGSSSR